MANLDYAGIQSILGAAAESILSFRDPKISRDRLTLPSPNRVDEVFSQTDRTTAVVDNLRRLHATGRLANTGYVSILPVDQGVEHSAGASFAPNPDYFDPAHIVKLAIEGGANAVASTLGVLALVSKQYASQIPCIVKINHNELLTYPNKHDQILFASAEQAQAMGAAGIGATIYFGSAESARQITEISHQFALAHQLGLFTVLWCYPRNDAFKTTHADYQTAADITGQAIHLGVTLGADIIKQKLPTTSYGFRDLQFGSQTEPMYQMIGEHPIDWTRYQVANAYMGKIGLINSGGPTGINDLHDAVMAAVINKRAGGMGLIAGRKVFSKPLAEGVALMHAIQDVYLCGEVTVA